MSHTPTIAVATCQDAATRVLTEYAATTRPEFLEFLVAPLEDGGHLATATALEDAIRRLHAERLAVVERQGYGAKPPSIVGLRCELVWPDPTKGTRLLVRL